MEYYAAELELNAKFHMFAQNCSQVHVGQNTVQQQLKFKSKRGRLKMNGYTFRGSNSAVLFASLLSGRKPMETRASFCIRKSF